MPGLINAHCHLDYTDMAGQFPPPKVFSDWLKLITEAKAGWDYSDYAQSWLNGARMLVRTGTTSVADIEAVPQLLPEVWGATPLRVFSFLEMIGIRGHRRPPVIVQEAVERIDSLKGYRGLPGLSPHAPYSTLPELLRLSAQTARRRNWQTRTLAAFPGKVRWFAEWRSVPAPGVNGVRKSKPRVPSRFSELTQSAVARTPMEREKIKAGIVSITISFIP